MLHMAERIVVKKEERGKKVMKRMKMVAVSFLSGCMAATGMAAAVPASVYSSLVPVTNVLAANSGTVYKTTNGVATMGSGNSSITIKGNDGQTLIGKTFSVYKLFNAENSAGGESINYTFTDECAQALKTVVAEKLSTANVTVSADDVTEYMVIDYIQSLNTNPVEGTRTEQTEEGSYSDFRYFIEDLRDAMETLGVTPDQVYVRNVQSDNSIQLSGLDYGYYVIDEVTDVQDDYSAASLCMVDTANPTAETDIKSDYPSVTKKIQEDDECDDITDDNNWNDIGDYEIGQTVPYKFTSDIPDINGYDTYYYAWHDVMDDALTFDKDSVVIKISGTDATGAAKTYTLTKSEFSINTSPSDGDTFDISITDIKAIIDREFDNTDNLGENTYGQTVVVTYDATLNDNAAKATGRPGFENDVCLEFSNDADSDGDGSTGRTPWDTVVCFTYELDVTKVNNHDKELQGAKFRLYSDEVCTNEVYVKEGNGGYIVINRDSLGGDDHTGGSVPGEAVEMVSASDGKFVIYGLDQGTYYLKETDAPDGYRLLTDPIELTITPTFTTERDSYVKGDGATATTLQKLEAHASVQSFYNGITHQDDDDLVTDVASGTVNMTVVNQVGLKLPITGTHATIILIGAGTAIMVTALVASRRKKQNNLPEA